MTQAVQPVAALAAIALVGVGIGWQFGLGYGLLAAGALLFADLRT